MPTDPAPPSSPLSVVAVIPARLASQRLPGKVLRLVAGRPLLSWVYEAARACPQLDRVIVAVDSPEVASLCEQNGWPYQMTSPDLPSGTDRLHAVSRELDAGLYVNIQGDEPLITQHHIAALLAPFQHPDVPVSTLKIQCTPDEVADPNCVKVVTAQDGRALYFSRATIPFDRDRTGAPRYFKHLGLYAYRRDALARFASLAPSSLEQTEKLEQLRLLEHGIPIYVSEVHEPTIGVDTEHDLRRVEPVLRARHASHAGE